ncbi:MAG: TetR/AcrR family transcriptional regulator [Roseiarcus sp.]|jgi:AcrR family transcriptional regulator
MSATETKPAAPRTYVISLENRKARGYGHERPEEILCAARALFLEHGVENVTTRQIAARVGISQTALYVYFKSKDEMLDRLVNAALAKLGAALDAVDAECADPIVFLRSNFRQYIRFGLEHPDEYRLVFMLRDGRRKAARPDARLHNPIGDALFDNLRRRIEQGIASDRLRCIKSGLAAAQSMWAGIHGLVALRLAYPDFDWIPVEEQIEAHVDMLLHGIVNPERGAAAEPC